MPETPRSRTPVAAPQSDHNRLQASGGVSRGQDSSWASGGVWGRATNKGRGSEKRSQPRTEPLTHQSRSQGLSVNPASTAGAASAMATAAAAKPAPAPGDADEAQELARALALSLRHAGAAGGVMSGIRPPGSSKPENGVPSRVGGSGGGLQPPAFHRRRTLLESLTNSSDLENALSGEGAVHSSAVNRSSSGMDPVQG